MRGGVPMESNDELSKYSLENFIINKSDDNIQETSKNKEVVLKRSRNIFEDMLLTINERKEIIDENVLSVISYCYKGFDDKNSYLKNVEKLHDKLLKLGNLYSYFVYVIPITADDYIAKEVTNLLQGEGPQIKKESIEKFIEKEEIYNVTSNTVINGLVKEAFISILRDYIKNEAGVNVSKVKNFTIKILSWTKEYVSQMFKSNIVENNPKIVYYGSIKKHESYFLIMAHMLGVDTLIFEPSGMSEWDKIDKEGKYALIYEGKIKENIKENPFNLTKQVIAKKEEQKIDYISQNILNQEAILAVSLKKSIDIFKDIKQPILDRGGSITGKVPIIPVYFYRYIGICDGEFAEIEYNNQIYLLDKELENGKYNYVKFINEIEPPQSNEVITNATILGNIFKKVVNLDGEVIFNEIKKNKLLPQSANKSILNTIEASFKEVFVLYLKRESTNLTKAKNFLAKLIIWINRYSKILFKGVTAEEFLNYNPKVLYFGEIKYTEVYMLIFLAKVGCDVLYINSNYKADDIFVNIDKEEQYTKLQKNSNNIEKIEFPVEEKLIRKATIAYDAADEVEQLLFTEDSGLYKPWQFERFNTIPVTLKTTFDEVSILWEEEARIRPNFKIANNTVYIPNIFAKINGTHTEVDKYWNFISKLRTAKDTCFIKSIPFSKANFTREEMFSIAYVINKDGIVDKDKLIQSHFYKFSYLKEATQNLIVHKMNELIKCDYFNSKADNRFILKIIFTVLNLQEEIVRLIQNFDFPFNIPKLIIYANDKKDFSEEDVITMVLLNIIGIDLIILTPTGYNNIENHIKSNVFDAHQLPSYKLDLQINETEIKKDIKSFFYKIFK